MQPQIKALTLRCELRIRSVRTREMEAISAVNTHEQQEMQLQRGNPSGSPSARSRSLFS